MEWIGKRIKARNKERLQVVNKRKKIEAKASVTSPAWKRKQRRQTDDDSYLEDITPASNDGLSAQVNLTQFASLRIGSEQDISVKDSLSRVIRDLEVHKSVPSSARLRDGSEQNLFVKDQCSPEIRCLNVEKSVPSSSRLRDGSEQNMCVKGQCSREVRCLNVEKSVPSSSRLRDGSEQNFYLKDKCSPEIRGLKVEKSVPSSAGSEENLCLKDKCSPEIRVLDVGKSVPEIEILSNSESENEERPSAKKKLFEENDCTVIESTSDEEDGTSETEEEEEDSSEDNNTKDDTVVKSLSSGDPSSSSSSCSSSSSSSFSSSDDEFNFKEVVVDTDDDTLRKARSPPVKKVSMAARKPLERYKRSGSSSTKPREEAKKIRKSNSREDEGRQDVVGIVTNQPSNAVFTCAHCGKENKGISNSRASFIRQQALRDDIEAVNNFTVTNLLNYEDAVSINSGKTPETLSRPELKNPETRKEVEPPQKPSTSRPEMFSSEREKEVQAPEKPSTSIPEMFSSEKAKELQAPGKPSTSRPEIFSLEKAKEVPALDKPSTSRPEIFSLEKAKEVPALEKPSTSRPEIFSLEKAKEVQALDKPSTSRPENFSLEKSKEVPAPGRPSRPEIQNSEKAKEVQTNNSVGSMIPALAEGLNKSVVTIEPIDYESDFSISSADKSGDESELEIRTTNNNAEWGMLNGNHKEVDIFRLLVNYVWEKGQLGEGGEEEGGKLVSSLEEQYQELAKEDQRKYDDDGLLIIRPPPLVERFGVKEPQSPPEMSDSEIEEAKLWEELAFYSKSNDLGIELLSQLEKEIATDESPAARCRKGNHELYLDIEVGLKCIHCGFVEREIRSMDASEWGEKNISGRRKIDRYEEEENNSFSGKLGFDEVLNKNSLNGGCVSSEGTVWDKIPGVKSQMYPHQQEGFEFIWRNLAGTIVLNELKDFENSDETGGCIMSHAPGTGKTRLTIIFLQAYLECFSNCKPVIIAPASLLLTWAEEFKKWNISIPFHNLSSLEFTGKESSAALGLLLQKNSSARSTNEIRMVKIYSWMKSKSILGISYNLYEKLAGVKDEDKKTKTAREVKPDKELEDIREILMGIPGLLVLDEAHTPRNQRSCIWKTLSKVETQKRILLSGTPFQNNFQELCNVLGLARPKYLERLTSTLKKSGMTVTKRGKRALGNEINNRGIEELKAVMLPFVHVHKGSILQKSLPGLRECVVVLNPPELQKRVLESIEVTHNRKQKNVFETEHKLSLVSVHPSLVSRCKLTEKEKLSIDEALLAQLKKVRLDPNQSVKTRFLMEFIGLCEVIKEKVLVFSQYIDPLKLIMKHLVSRFNWNPGEEVLYMHGKIEQRQRQTLINEFNDPKSKAKVFLASTKACSEGISLVGASRVILLDVVWNPAVERQAISRAYRIGQQRIVYTYHLVAKGTPEGPKYCKQAQKDRISELVFACSSRPDKGKEKIAEAVTEDKVLDTMVQHSKLRDMFDNLIVQPKETDLVEGFSILMP